MPYNFDANYYKKKFDTMFGAGQYDAGMARARQIGQSNAQVDLAKQLYNQRHTSSGAVKKSYQDAVEYISNNKDQFLNPDLNGGKSGAYQIANEIRNDPAKQAQIKAQGYNVSDYINALYAGLSDGNFRSEREYKQNVSQQKKDISARDAAYRKKHGGLSQWDVYDLQKKAEKKPPKKNNKNEKPFILGIANNIGGLFKDLGHDVSQRAKGTGNELANIWKAISDGPGGYKLSDVANSTQKTIKSQQKADAQRGFSSPLSKEVHRGANRAVDAAFLGNMSAYQNAENSKGYGFNTNYANTRQFGKGGATDFLTSGLGYLLPGNAAYKSVAGVGERVAGGLSKLSPKLANIAGKTVEGSAAGGVFGTMQSIADPNMSIKQRMANIGFNVAGGAVLDPLLHGLGAGIGRLRKGNPMPEITNAIKQEPLGLPAPKVAGYLNEGQKQLPPPMRLNEPMQIDQPSGPAFIQGARREKNPYTVKFEQLVNDFNKLQSQGLIPPGKEEEVAVEMWNNMAGPHDPSFEQMLHLANDRPMVTPQQKPALIQQARKNAKAPVYGIDNIYGKLKLKQPMERQPLQYVGKGSMPNLKVQQVSQETPPLKFSKEVIAKNNPVNPLQTKLNPNKEVAATAEKVKKNPDYINVSSEPGLVKASTKNAELEKLLSNSDNWKDKGNLSYGRETMDRNFEDVMGKDAPKMKKVFLDPIKENETSRVKFLNAEREQVKSYGIKPKSQDDKLVQMFGEGKISLAELKQQTPNWKKVVKVANAYRAKYDELLTNVNKVLEANGYDPIPKRANYFPHYEEIDGLLHKLGFDMNNNMLPTDINGLTDSFKPGKNFFRNALQRKGDQTTFGAIEGFDKYIEGISNVIYHTKDIKNIRALEKAIRNKYEGDTHLSNFVTQLDEYGNILAGKKSKIDRAAEFFMGRKVYNALDTIRRRVGANIIGANISSALSNFIPFTQSLATTDKQSFAKAMFDTLANVVKKDGIVNESGFLTRRIGSDPLYRNLWDKTVDKSMWLMKTLDKFSSQVIVRSKYYEGLKKGLSPKEAMKQADDWAGKLMADRSKGQMPPMFNSKTLGVLSQFQLEVNNQLSFLLKDIPRTMDKKAAASAFAQVALYSYLFNDVYEKMMGRRPAFDPLGVALQAYKDYNNDNITKSKASVNLFENVANQLPFTSALTGGRYPISAGLPSVPNLIDAAKQNQFSQQLKKEAVKPLFDLLPPTGGNQVKKTYEGLTTLGKGGEYLGNKMKYPISNTPGNELRGALFGKYAFPEANQYYNNSRRILNPKQTKQVEQSSNPKQTYEDIQFKRRETTLLSQIQKVVNSNKSQKEKNNQVNELQKRLQRLREGR